MKKLLALFLTLTLCLSLAAPALAVEDTDPLWQQYGYSSLEEMLEDWGITEEEYNTYLPEIMTWLGYQAARDAYLEAHPDALDGFDPHLYFSLVYFWFDSEEEYMEIWLDAETDFATQMEHEYLDDLIDLDKQLADFPEKKASFDQTHPGLTDGFDAYAYFAGQTDRDNFSAQDIMALYRLTEEEFYILALSAYMDDVLWEEAEQAQWQETLALFDQAHPGLVAAFDPEAYFEAYFDYYSSPQEYMDAWSMTREEFEQEMLQYYVNDILWEEAEQAEWQEILAQFEQDHPGLIAAFDPEAYFEENFYYYSSLQEYMDAWDMTREEFEQDMLQNYVNDILWEEAEQAEWQETLAQFEQDHPGLIAAFDADAYFTEGFYYYDSPQAYMDAYGMTREEFEQEMLSSYIWDIRYQESQSQLIAQFGGVPGQYNVMVNGVCVTFPDAAPQAANGRIMVPFRPLLESLGAQVDYNSDTGTVTAVLGGKVLTHVIGSDAVSVSENGQVETITMDVPSFAQQNRTYVPVRFLSQALGFQVDWDSLRQTVIVLDMQGYKDRINAQCSLLNQVVQDLAETYSTPRDGKAYLMKCGLKIDSDDFAMDAGGSIVTDGTDTSIAFTIDGGALVDIIFGTDVPVTSPITLNVMNKGETYYFNNSLLTDSLGIGKNIWAAFTMEEFFELMGVPAEDCEDLLSYFTGWQQELDLDDIHSLGDALVGWYLSISTYGGADIYTAGELEELISGLTETVGDDQFTHSGSTYTLQYSKDEYVDSSDVTLKFTQTKQGYDTALTYTYSYSTDYYSADMQITLTENSDGIQFKLSETDFGSSSSFSFFLTPWTPGAQMPDAPDQGNVISLSVLMAQMEAMDPAL